jgi:quercetin dioxygenase-like cupin family protein
MIVDQPEIKFVSKGWGFEKWAVNTDKYCGKLLYFAKSKRCSLHYHKLKDETFFVHSGKIKVYYSDNLAKLESTVKEWLFQMEKEDNNKLFALTLGSARSHDSSLIKEITLNPGDDFYIPPGRVHQMVAVEDTELYEFSTTHRDDDSYRLIKGD